VCGHLPSVFNVMSTADDTSKNMFKINLWISWQGGNHRAKDCGNALHPIVLA